MKTLTLIVLLFTSQFANAISANEQTCVAKMVYHEARSLPPNEWLKVANVTFNRSKYYQQYHFGSKSNHLCDIVKSSQYSSRNLLTARIKEPEVYKEIRKILLAKDWRTVTKALYFETKKGRMIYKTNWRK